MMITVKYMKDDSPLVLRSMRGETREALVLQYHEALRNGGYVDAARIDTDNLDHAYALMQNGVHSESWTLAPPPEVTPLLAPVTHAGRVYGNRSAMIGDLFEHNGTLYACAVLGFLPLPATVTDPKVS